MGLTRRSHQNPALLESLITSQTRIKLLVKFFLNSATFAYLRGLESEFEESSNAIRLELNRFEQAGLLTSFSEGNKKMYRANTQHPFFTDIHKLLLKYVGIDQLINEVVSHIGNLEKAYITGDFAKGNPGKLLDLLLVGTDFDEKYIRKLVLKAEENVSFRINYQIVGPGEEDGMIEKALLVWNNHL